MIWKRLMPLVKSIGVFASGFLITYSLAPFDQWYLGILGPCLLYLFLRRSKPQRYFLVSWLFGLGLFFSGTSWVFVAIHEFAYTPIPLAVTMTGMFVSGMALVFAIPFLIYAKYLQATQSRYPYLIFAVFWVLGEWLRTWLLTGFPWLFVGYAHVDTWLSGWAPITGVLGISFFAILSGTLIVQALLTQHRRILASATAIVIWLTGYLLTGIEWNPETQEDDQISVAIVQPNIPLEIKWDPNYRAYILDILQSESANHWDKDIVFWPEAAIPLLFQDANLLLSELDEKAKSTNTSLITGILYDDLQTAKVYNSILSIGEGDGTYFKQRLVPFGEYVPLEKWLRGLIHFFDLPNSFIYPGPKQQAKLIAGSHSISPFICYEIVYPDLVAKSAKAADIMVTISNDAWFGHSIGPLQHLQMAQMRALENSRYLVRATNTGVSGIIDHKGQIILLADQFSQDSISATVNKRQGLTPFSVLGSLPIIAFCLLILIINMAQNWANNLKLLNRKKIT